MNTPQKIESIRKLMMEFQLDAYIIPSTDPHQNEYLPEYWKVRAWVSGFTGSVGTVVITKDFAGLWTDSRYFLQAENQLKGSGIELVKLKIPHTPEHVDWLVDKMPEKSKIGINGNMVSLEMFRFLEKSFKPKQIQLDIEHDPVSPLWQDRPHLSKTQIFTHDIKYAGKTRKDKLEEIRKIMLQKKADYHFIASLDDIAWLFNIRGSDVIYNPVVVSYALVSMNKAILFINPYKVPLGLSKELETEGITLVPYAETGNYLAKLEANKSILLAPARVNKRITDFIPQEVSFIEDMNPSTLLKAQKNETEINNLRETFIKDGIAMVKFLNWLDKNIGQQKITEISASEKLLSFRKEQADCIGESFSTIAGYKDHGAIVHYGPAPETDVELKPEGLFLLDSGGQYLGGTTDITRIIPLGKPTAEEQRDFTLALKGTLSISMLQFPYGTKGFQIDVLARKALWDHGMNYGHGTGHGVGYFLNVHEGPQGIGTSALGNQNIILEKGMVLTVEPGFYREGKHGIRTENMLLVAESKITDYGEFLKFETLTLCPIEIDLIDLEIMDKEEIEWLNQYHKMVYERLKDGLSEEEREWLKIKTRKLGNL